jgi:hypothetical protein
LTLKIKISITKNKSIEFNHFQLTVGHKLVNLDHEAAMISKVELLIALIELWSQKDSDHAQAWCARVVVGLNVESVWHVLEMSESGGEI